MAFVTPENTIESLRIQQGEKIADFGGGSGAYTISALRTLRGSGKVYAIDLNKELLQKVVNEAQHINLPNVEAVWADVEVPHSTNLHDMSIDSVIFSNLLFQLDDRKSALQEARRILKPKGMMLVVDWTDSFGGMASLHPLVVAQALQLQARAKILLITSIHNQYHPLQLQLYSMSVSTLHHCRE
jgi:ubiquinone/menaquinone biosynthesis C-methylase UbiE